MGLNLRGKTRNVFGSTSGGKCEVYSEEYYYSREGELYIFEEGGDCNEKPEPFPSLL